MDRSFLRRPFDEKAWNATLRGSLFLKDCRASFHHSLLRVVPDYSTDHHGLLRPRHHRCPGNSEALRLPKSQQFRVRRRGTQSVLHELIPLLAELESDNRGPRLLGMGHDLHAKLHSAYWGFAPPTIGL